MIEDDYLDVLGKAMQGHGLGARQLVEAAGIDASDWDAFAGGCFSEQVARACARVLALGADAYAAHPAYQPKPLATKGIRRIELPFGAFGVNAWWLECDGVAILLDTGCSAGELAAVLPHEPAMVCITHGHHDHTGGLGYFRGSDVPIHAARGVAGAAEIIDGQTLECGSFRLRAIDVSGHFTPAVAYHVSGLDQPLMVVGDALFAGSIGKCANPSLYQTALANLGRAFAGQPDELVILPGHGPATTLGEERRSNPFLAGMSAVDERP